MTSAVLTDAPPRPASRSILHDYALTWVLASLFVVSWFIQAIAGWVVFGAEQRTHGEAASFFGSEGYFPEFLTATMENWQSEFLQLFTFVVLSSLFIHRGSPQSKDGDEELKSMIKDLRARVDRLVPAQ